MLEKIVSFRDGNAVFYSSNISTLFGDFKVVLDYSGKIVRISLPEDEEEAWQAIKSSNIYLYIKKVIFKVEKQLNLYFEGDSSMLSIPYSLATKYEDAKILEFVLKTEYAKVYTLEQIHKNFKERTQLEVLKILEENPLPFIIPTYRISDLTKFGKIGEAERNLFEIERANMREIKEKQFLLT